MIDKIKQANQTQAEIIHHQNKLILEKLTRLKAAELYIEHLEEKARKFESVILFLLAERRN